MPDDREYLRARLLARRESEGVEPEAGFADPMTIWFHCVPWPPVKGTKVVTTPRGTLRPGDTVVFADEPYGAGAPASSQDLQEAMADLTRALEKRAGKE